MSGPPRLQRALLLQEQGRHELAEKELRQHLVDDPTDGLGHALLAMSLLAQERFDDAEQEAREAIGHEPDLPGAYHALAVVLSDRRRLDEAGAAIREAVRLDPTNPDHHAMRSGIALQQRDWQAALDAAEDGLRFDAEHVGLNNTRAMALVNLGRRGEAGMTLDHTLAREPENAISHANKGWTLLEDGSRDQAMEHFREALRIDPTNAWARAGLVEALKAKNPLYALMLRYFLWVEKLSDRAGWGVILGGYIAYRFLANLARTNPGVAPFVTPLLVVYIAFALLTWLARPLFNVMLLLHPIGRHALDDDQLAQARWVGSTLALALACVLLTFTVPGLELLTGAISFGLLSLPLSAVHYCSPGWPRRTMAGVVAGLGVLGVSGSVIIDLVRPAEGSGLEGAGMAAFGLFVVGVLLSQFGANWLVRQSPTR